MKHAKKRISNVTYVRPGILVMSNETKRNMGWVDQMCDISSPRNTELLTEAHAAFQETLFSGRVSFAKYNGPDDGDSVNWDQPKQPGFFRSLFGRLLRPFAGI